MTILVWFVVWLLGAALMLYFVAAPAVVRRSKRRHDDRSRPDESAPEDRAAATFLGTVFWPVILVVFGLMRVFEKGVERETKKSK